MTTVIKPYEIEDIIWVVEEASYKSMVEDAGRPDLFHRQRWYEIASTIEKSGIGFIAWKGEEKIGMIGALITPHFFNPDIKTSTVITWYVTPRYRKTRVPLMLLRAMEEESRNVSDALTFSVVGHNKIKDTSLSRLGFTLTDSMYTKAFGEK